MIVAATTVNWQHGWQAVHDLMSPWANQNAEGAIERLDKAKELLEYEPTHTLEEGLKESLEWYINDIKGKNSAK